jgi:hypothetical protein
MTYCGATSRLLPDAGLTLPDGWGYQPKIDGEYAEVILDPAGRIASVRSRAGHELPAADLLGIHAGPPRSIYVGELEASTEAGNAAAKARGWRNLHLFDVLAVKGVGLRRRPYEARHAWLHKIADWMARRGTAHVDHWIEEPSGRPAFAIKRREVIGTRPRCPVTGRRVSRIPRDLRRLPIVPLVRGHEAAAALWRDYVERDHGEGLVAVRLDAPAGAPSSKRKIKLVDTADCEVIDTSPKVLRLRAPLTSPAGWRRETFVVQYNKAATLTPGAIVEVAHDGWYASGIPKFPRVVRVREDLSTSQRRIAS